MIGAVALPGEPSQAARARARRRPQFYLSRAHARLVRAAYRIALPAIVRRRVETAGAVEADVFTFCGQGQLPEQVASIRSFLRHVGEPASLTVISDGTLDEPSRSLLARLGPAVRVADVEDLGAVPAAVAAYAVGHPLGRKLAAAVALPVRGPAIYMDSDVLFFRGGAELRQLTVGGRSWYLQDEESAFDTRLLRDADEGRPPVNSGFFVLQAPLDWAPALERLERLTEPAGYHTEQTVVHLAMRGSGASPLPRERFVLRLDDVFSYRDSHAGDAIALRHYVRPVRYKFWLALSRPRRRQPAGQ
jgi:hypothetical protein